MSLKEDLLAWDGKSAEDIRRIYLHYADRPSFSSDLIALSGDVASETAATWLLKHHLESGWRDVSPADLAAIYSHLTQMEHWEAKLHVLQSMEYLPIPEAHTTALKEFLRDAISDDAKFVRAWGYHGLHQLGRQYPAYRDEVSGLLNDAMETETAASVKVRIRKALEAGF